jgi:hypothetical protein
MMRRDILFSMRKLILLTLLGCSALLGADITGTWDFVVETGQGSGNPAFTFKQRDEKLTGTYSGLFGKAEVTGTVKGDAVEFAFEVSVQGQTAKMRYTGKIESPTRMKGEVAMGEIGNGTWTATKK